MFIFMVSELREIDVWTNCNNTVKSHEGTRVQDNET